ncbi:MAG: hypothetical protein LWW85_03735 [Marinilabiliales bacterium]|nr:hypothetical protein [Marinilabiliales bacterium]
MYKRLMTLLLLIPWTLMAQERMDFEKADSLSYRYFVNQDWQKLISLTKSSFQQGIDSKLLHQRAGYALYQTGDYFGAMENYAQAYQFDTSDPVSRAYLYYASLLAGGVNTRYYAGLLDKTTQAKLQLHAFNPVESIDLEANVKSNSTRTRSNQSYYRIGIGTDLGYHVKLYQAISYYEQTVSQELTRQPEYLALLKWNLSTTWQLKAAYHHLFSSVAGVNYPGNQLFGAVRMQRDRFHAEANVYQLRANAVTTNQMGLEGGYVFPGSQNLYLTSSLAAMSESGSTRAIFSQTAGLKLTGNLWAEGNVTFGDLENYSTQNSLYVYNALDPSVFRTGGTLTYFTGKHMSFFFNFTFDQQLMEGFVNKTYYYQYSYSGGLKWKL